MSGKLRVPQPWNEPVFEYAPGSPERASLKERLAQMADEVVDIPLIVGGEEIRTGKTGKVVMPHDHAHVLATYHKAGPEEIQRAVDASQEARKEWAAWPWEDRASVFLRAAELLSSKWRDTINAATMLGQSKTVHQAEIDSAAELVDFFRFNAHFAQELYEEQPISSKGVWNWAEYRPLEGFIYAITPFNFTSIAGNLPSAPALMGNTVLWKPARTSLLSSYYSQKLFEEAGVPPGVINFIMGNSAEITNRLFSDPYFAGVHFTGSTPVFQISSSPTPPPTPTPSCPRSFGDPLSTRGKNAVPHRGSTFRRASGKRSGTRSSRIRTRSRWAIPRISGIS